MYVAGVSTTASTNYGTFNLGTDNEYIASLGLTQGDLNDDDIVNDSDVTIFVDNWRRQQLLSGRRTGDLNSRMFGDFDYDGFVGILDWHVIRRDPRQRGVAESWRLAGATPGVPEPGTGLLLVDWVAGRRALPSSAADDLDDIRCRGMCRCSVPAA